MNSSKTKSLSKNLVLNELLGNDINFSKICRTCLVETEDNDLSNESLCIIDSSGKLVRIYEMFEAATGLKILANDDMPHHICSNCLQSVNNCYKFRSECQRTEEILQKILLAKNDLPEEDLVSFQDLEQEDIFLEEGEELLDEEEEQPSHDDEETMLLPEQELSSPDEEVIYPEKESLLAPNTISDEELVEMDDAGEEFSQEETEVEVKYQITNSEDSLSDFAEVVEIKEVPRLTSTPPIKCDFCDEMFALQRDLINHYRDCHPTEKPFKCEVCSVPFVHIQSMRRHKKTHVASAKEKMCPYCSKTFHRSDDLTRHMRIHTDERPFTCTVCQKAFKQHTELKDHMLSHDIHKKFKCVPCKKEWRSRNGWYLHMKAHRAGKASSVRKRKVKIID